MHRRAVWISSLLILTSCGEDGATATGVPAGSKAVIHRDLPEAEVAQRFESQTLFPLTDGREVTGLATGVIEDQRVIAVSTQRVVVGQEGAWIELFSADENGVWVSIYAHPSCSSDGCLRSEGGVALGCDVAFGC